MVYDGYETPMNYPQTPELQARGMIQESPGHFEPGGKIGCQGFDTECFGRVMPAVQNVQTQVFSQGISPMLPFARDERVHLLIRRLLQIVARATAHDANAAADRRGN